MKIQIKNVTGSNYNNWCIWELQREGYPEGSIIEDPQFNEKNNSFTWGNCVAWLNETCIIIEDDKNT